MSLLEVLQFVGYGMGAALTLWMGALLLKWRRGLGGLERVLLALAVSIGVWHTSNLILTLHTLLGLDAARSTLLLRFVDTVAVASIIFAYSFLLHAHLHLWANARARPLTLFERARVYLSYVPTFFLIKAIPHLWTGEYAPMLVKLSQVQLLAWPDISYVQAFTFWALYVLALISATDLIIAHVSQEQNERRFVRTLAGSFLLIGLLILTVYVLGIGRGTMTESYLVTLANLGSLLPTALLAHRIYRHRYLDLVIRESLVVATFAALVLVVYLFGIRAVGAWMTERYSLRTGIVESLLILGLALIAQPLRKWLENRFHQLFEKEANLYREVVARIGKQSGQFRQLPELLHFVEARIAQDLGLRKVLLHAADVGGESSEANLVKADANDLWLEEALEQMKSSDGQPLQGLRQIKEHGYELAFPLKRENRLLGMMLIDAPAESLTGDARVVLEVLAGQVAVAIEDCHLLEENVRLERRLAQDERLAALGQMAATVAHEIKNPLSAIKSIAQVLREDKQLGAYERDLSLIVGETDRLNGNVTQLLSFARRAPEPNGSTVARADELARAVTGLFRAQAERSGVSLSCHADVQSELNGTLASVLRDALSNLILNALQATPSGGQVTIEVSQDEDELCIAVSNTGQDIPVELQARIWEPFFTTKQRGTGLGLAIVRKRVEEIGGSAHLAWSNKVDGTRFIVRLPFAHQTISRP